VDHKGHLPVENLCKIMRISKSGFYAWQKRPKSAREQADQAMLSKICFFFDRSRQNYGCRRIADDLHEEGVRCSKNRVLRLMRKKGLRSSHTKKFKVVTTDSNHDFPVAPNVLDREFIARRPNEKWAGDMTYIHTQEGWLYLAVLLDLYSRKVVGVAIEDHMKTALCSDALQSALTFRRPGAKLLHHSDRGSQYASDDYQQLLRDHDCTASMSRKGNCWDNAVVESFFHTLKVECVYKTRYKTKQQAKEDIIDYIFNFYNCDRKHSALDYKSPIQYERMAA